MKYLPITAILLLAILLNSCKKWMDVDARSVVKEEEIFEDANGFRSALLGVYTQMGSTSLYGANLTIGFIDVLAQYYAIESSQHSFYSYSQYDYKERKSTQETIWRTAYNTIANCNNILEHLEGKEAFFSNDEFKIIKGEALAIRAFLHFDMVRLFAPSYGVNKSAPAIPYVNKISTRPFTQLTVEEVLKAVEADLGIAAELLKESDPWSAYYNGLAGPVNELPNYLSFREERMNYYAVLGTLAKVNLYMDKTEQAYEYSSEVLEKKPIGVLFSLFTKKSWDNSDLYFNSEASSFVKLIVPEGRKDEFYETAKYGSVDRRYKDWFKYYPGSSEEFMSKYMRSIPQYGNPPNMIIMRAEDMSYILAETAPTEIEAFKEINKIRGRYGIGLAHYLYAGTDDLELEIMKEYRKMFIGEGKFFYYLKRKNMDPIPYSLIENVGDAYVIPIPDSEKEFGNIN